MPVRADHTTGHPPRELAVDLYRTAAVALVVVGHWLASTVAYRNGQFVRENALAELPWTQWLTWIFQVVPVFFLVAGYAGAASWTQQGVPYRDWLQKRARGVLGPTTAYVGVILVILAIAGAVRVDPSTVALSGWSLAMHLWFIPVYLAVVALTPVAVRMHRRCGLVAPLVLGLAVTTVDVVSVSGWLPAASRANDLLCWLALFQIGVAWFFGGLRGGRAIWLSVLGGVIAAVAIGVGPYPVALIVVPGQTVQNSSPPSVVMLAEGLLQAGLLISIAPAVTRRLRGATATRRLAAANSRGMLVYLWHMVAVVVFAVVVYPAKLFPQPALGTGAWWWSRALWVAELSVVMAGVLLLVGLGRRVLAADLAFVPARLPGAWSAPMLIGGGAAAAAALWYFSTSGFAPDGRIPGRIVMLFALGIVLVSLCPSGRRTLSDDPGTLVGISRDRRDTGSSP